MKYTDEVKIDTEGDLRIARLYDGMYVVGKGMMIPVENAEEARSLINELKEPKKN